MGKKIKSILLAFGMAATLVLGLPAMATAAESPGEGLSAAYTSQNGWRNANEVLFYYNSNRGGSFSDFFWADNDFVGSVFLSSGAGYRQPMKNNSASVWNTNNGYAARVYFNSGWQGASDTVARASWINLKNTYNNNASFRFI